jgi:hypothetical protein
MVNEVVFAVKAQNTQIIGIGYVNLAAARHEYPVRASERALLASDFHRGYDFLETVSGGVCDVFNDYDAVVARVADINTVVSDINALRIAEVSDTIAVLVLKVLPHERRRDEVGVGLGGFLPPEAENIRIVGRACGRGNSADIRK